MTEPDLRLRTWKIVEVAEPGDRTSWLFDVAIRALIALNVLAVVLETVPEVYAVAGAWLRIFDLLSVGVFTVEYVARVWSCTADARYQGAIHGRWRFARTPLALVDLLAILPFWLPAAGVDLRILRGVRLFRLFRILKIARYSRSLRMFGRVFRDQKEELLLTLALVFSLVLLASTLLYFVENPAQPDVFSSVPAAMWWGVVTLTTVGYGDVYPITTLGRFLGGIFALCAVLLIALPTAILGAAFVSELQRERADRAGEGGGEAGVTAQSAGSPGPGVCPHCGKALTGD